MGRFSKRVPLWPLDEGPLRRWDRNVAVGVAHHHSGGVSGASRILG
jgi:hypothetical protein